MSETRSHLAEQAEALRRAFDRGFAAAARLDVTPTEDLLAFRVGSEPYALRLSEITGIFVDRKIAPLPGGHAALLGLAGFRGAVVPVYDLPLLLGRAALETPRWLAIASAAPVAFAFAVFEGHVRIPREAITPRQDGGPSSAFVREFATSGELARPIVHLPAVLAAIQTPSAGANS